MYQELLFYEFLLVVQALHISVGITYTDSFAEIQTRWVVFLSQPTPVTGRYLGFIGS